MRPKTPEQIVGLLTREGWHPAVVFNEGAKDCRNAGANLIRDAVALLRRQLPEGLEVRALVEVVGTEDSDDALEEAWRTAVDALRALYRTSPVGTRREREILVGIARNDKLVKAMVAAASSQQQVAPSWLAVFNAHGSPNSAALVKGQAPRLSEHPRLAAAISSFEGALQSSRTSSVSRQVPSSDTSCPVRIGNARLTKAHFWSVINGASGTVDPVSTLGRWLSEMRPAQVAEFSRHFSAAMDRAYRHDLWGAAFVLLGGCSDDSFDDFRAELILRGKDVFEDVLDNPDTLADHTDIEGDESAAALAAQVYEEKTGLVLASPTAASRLPQGKPFDLEDDKELRKRYPRLCALEE